MSEISMVDDRIERNCLVGDITPLANQRTGHVACKHENGSDSTQEEASNSADGHTISRNEEDSLPNSTPESRAKIGQKVLGATVRSLWLQGIPILHFL